MLRQSLDTSKVGERTIVLKRIVRVDITEKKNCDGKNEGGEALSQPSGLRCSQAGGVDGAKALRQRVPAVFEEKQDGRFGWGEGGKSEE